MESQRFFPWREEYSLGIKVIDDHHKQLVGYIDEMYVSAIQTDSKDKAKEILKKLYEYTVYHFGVEERYFEKFGYEEIAEHKQQHQIFYQKLNDFKKMIDKNHPSTFQIINFLKEWFKEHILDTDKKYVNELKIKIENDN